MSEADVRVRPVSLCLSGGGSWGLLLITLALLLVVWRVGRFIWVAVRQAL
jgi:hypothetical protein